jgi:hypothetical protein
MSVRDGVIKVCHICHSILVDTNDIPAALVNGTLYIYGGQASTDPGQTENLWSKTFIDSPYLARLTALFRQRFPLHGSYQNLANLYTFSGRSPSTIWAT